MFKMQLLEAGIVVKQLEPTSGLASHQGAWEDQEGQQIWLLDHL